MKTIARILALVFFFICVCYYFEIDIKGTLSGIIPGTDNNTSSYSDPKVAGQRGTVTMTNSGQDISSQAQKPYEEAIRFIINQKKGKKLVESYGLPVGSAGSYLRGRSYIKDNGMAVIALINCGDEESKSAAYDILKNMSEIQNEDGSWYDLYDTLGQPVKIDGKDYKECDTGYNALMLYAYSCYTILTGDTQFKDVMKSSADFIASRYDGTMGGLYDNEVSANGTRSVRTNTYGYFGLREYAMSNIIFQDYKEYKAVLSQADRIASWVAQNCLDNGMFMKGYSGKDKIPGLNLDAQVLGAMLMNGTDSIEEVKYGSEYIDGALSKLYKQINDLKGYLADDDPKNSGFIWCEGTCKVPIALLKSGDRDGAGNALGFIEGYMDIVPKGSVPRGVPYSTNADPQIYYTDLESVSSSAWAAISFQCYSSDAVNDMFLGREADVFNKVRLGPDGVLTPSGP